jgi:Family of unknown function (DUF6186)
MSARELTLFGYGAVAGTGVILQLLAWRGASWIAPLGRALGRVMRTRAGRVGVIAGWAWFGLHLFAR